jgi:hypothetical protein
VVEIDDYADVRIKRKLITGSPIGEREREIIDFS